MNFVNLKESELCTLTMLNARMMHDCVGVGDIRSERGEQFGDEFIDPLLS